MGTKPKTRFTVIVGEQPHELFSIRERTNGDLLITRRHGSHFESVEGPTRILGQRLSVHRSLLSASGGYTIKQTLLLAGDRQLDGAQFRCPSLGRFAAVMFSATCPDLRNGKYLMKARNKDRVTSIGERGVGNDTAFYHVIVSDYPISPEILGTTRMTVRTTIFKHFIITTMAGAFAVPAIPQCDLLHLFTSRIRSDPNEPPEQLAVRLESFSPQDIVDYAKLATTMLANGTYLRHHRLVFDNGERLTPEQLHVVERELTRYRAL